MKTEHPWKVRLLVGSVMLLLAFVGMIITDVHSTAGWDYWKWLVPVYALLALGLSFYVRRQLKVVTPITLWHELLHWVGLFLSVLLVSLFVKLGLISPFAAGLFDLTLLSLALFLAGIYIETTFIFIGILLGIFALLAALVVQYLFALLIPLMILGVAGVIFTVWFSHKKFKAAQK